MSGIERDTVPQGDSGRGMKQGLIKSEGEDDDDENESLLTPVIEFGQTQARRLSISMVRVHPLINLTPLSPQATHIDRCLDPA